MFVIHLWLSFLCRLLQALEAVGLKAAISELEGSLSAKVVDNGGNFSLVRCMGGGYYPPGRGGLQGCAV